MARRICDPEDINVVDEISRSSKIIFYYWLNDALIIILFSMFVDL